MDNEEALGELGTTLEAWVVNQCNEWREAQEANYFEKWDEYYRIWRGQWSPNDRERSSERSKLISPATQQAVESSVSEMEEATFGRGSFFDIHDEMGDQKPQDVEFLKNKLAEEFKYNNVRKDVAECLLNAAVFGTGVGEIVISSETHYSPATQKDEDGVNMVGRTTEQKTCVSVRPIKPHNLRIPDTATNIKDALGVGIEEFVAKDYVYDLQEQGVYVDTDFALHGYAADDDLEADPSLDSRVEDRVKLLRYYGKVPRHLLEEVEGFESSQNHSDTYYTEAVVVIANDGVLLKADDNPYLMNDRPVIAFQWDIVPGRFWGRGVCEKGYNPQKALDAELRQRRDAMAMNVAPMLGIDATRLPMLGQKLQVSPGKQIMVNGNPSEILHPFRFGDVPQSSWMETENLQNMVQQATGAVDSAGVAGSINNEATAAGISMSLGAIIKRHKRTLINFQEGFLIPLVRKAAWRYMQFDADNFPVEDYDFVVTSSLGIVAREYETSQLVQLMQTTSPESPIYPLLVESVVDNMNLSNRQELIDKLRQAQQPSEEQMKAQQAAQQREQEVHQAQLAVLQAQAEEFKARANKYNEEARLMPLGMQIDMINGVADVNNDAADDFAKSLQVAQQSLAEKKQAHQEKIDIANFALSEKNSNKAPQQENANGSQQSGIPSSPNGNQ